MEFQLGQLCTTAGVMQRMVTDDAFARHVGNSFARYQRYDWGELDGDDKNSNDLAVIYGNNRIFAAYKPAAHPDWKIWIITEEDRSVTTILFPDEY